MSGRSCSLRRLRLSASASDLRSEAFKACIAGLKDCISAENDLEELEISRLSLAQPTPLPHFPVYGHKEQTGVNVFELEPVKKGKRGSSAAPVQQGTQLIQERHRREDAIADRA